MDPLESLNIKDDTTLAIIEECLLRKFEKVNPAIPAPIMAIFFFMRIKLKLV